MLTVGRDISSSSASRQPTSCTQWSTPSSFFAVASSSRRAASPIIVFSAAESGRAFAVKPSMAGSLPSGETSVASAMTRCHAGLSSRALLLEWTSLRGPRPQRSPLETSSSSTTPLAPSVTVTSPSSPCEALGMKIPLQRFNAACTSGRRTICGKCGEPISSSPSATNTRFTGSFRPAPRMAWRAARNAASGPFWFTAPRPTRTFPRPGLSTSAASNGGDDHSAGSTCFTSYMKYKPSVFGAPASSAAKTPGWPSVGIFVTAPNPASRSIRIRRSQPSVMPRFSAAIDGCRIHSCNRCTASSWRFTMSA